MFDCVSSYGQCGLGMVERHGIIVVIACGDVLYTDAGQTKDMSI